ncbi:RICIN domain-containing protein [Streptomyces sp. NBC_00536]|uniref:RICIN domain-containing protein n=1 Tax=Streptomyces sp. NBC_00536 TaxID=2975769 RepID=UPI002E7FD5EA|nr:RICIN domain-containing protein [Streptomyces sp. NBC_00536]WUC82604.1 RICIN domain-containing protein [Streptomyces sp. NBC_00536]
MSGGGEDGDSGGDAFHGPAGVQRGSGNLQVNFHEHRTGILSACAVALVCAVTVIAVRLGGDPGAGSAAAPTGTPDVHTAPAPAPRPDPTGPDPSVLTGRLVNHGSALCLRDPGAAQDPVPVQDTCTGDADRSWTLATRDGGATRTLRDGLGGRCLTVTGSENFAPVRLLACTAQGDGQRWKLLWGTGDRAGLFALRADGNAKCLMVQGREASRPAAQTSCGEEYDDQWWHLAP